MSNEQVPQMMMQLTLYSDSTLTLDGRAKTEAVPYILRQIADALENGGVNNLVDIPLN